MVPDVRMLDKHPTDVAFWKAAIANGKPGTLMRPLPSARADR